MRKAPFADPLAHAPRVEAVLRGVDSFSSLGVIEIWQVVSGRPSGGGLEARPRLQPALVPDDRAADLLKAGGQRQGRPPAGRRPGGQPAGHRPRDGTGGGLDQHGRRDRPGHQERHLRLEGDARRGPRVGQALRQPAGFRYLLIAVRGRGCLTSLRHPRWARVVRIICDRAVRGPTSADRNHRGPGGTSARRPRPNGSPPGRFG
jgi:hypothetical protein